MFRGVKKAVNTNDDIENIKDARKAKRQDKESVRIAEAYEKHIASIKSQKTKVPAARYIKNNHNIKELSMIRLIHWESLWTYLQIS